MENQEEILGAQKEEAEQQCKHYRKIATPYKNEIYKIRRQFRDGVLTKDQALEAGRKAQADYEAKKRDEQFRLQEQRNKRDENAEKNAAKVKAALEANPEIEVLVTDTGFSGAWGVPYQTYYKYAGTLKAMIDRFGVKSDKVCDAKSLAKSYMKEIAPAKNKAALSARDRGYDGGGTRQISEFPKKWERKIYREEVSERDNVRIIQYEGDKSAF